MVYNGFSQYDGLAGVEFMPSEPYEKKKSSRRDPDADILDLIYMPDPVTGFPSGALSHYLSDSVRPEIRQFIEDNILRDLPNDHVIDFSDEISRHFRDLSDDFKFDVMRGRYEDVETYKERITTTLKKMAESEKNEKFAKELFEAWQKQKNGKSV